MSFFSVIIPTYNRPERLANCLQTFSRLDYPPDRWELIVVNDGGSTSFDRIDEQLRDTLPLCLLDIPHGGPARARNAGADRARGDYLAFTDDDCVVDSGWLRAFAAAFETTPLAAVGGQTLNPHQENLPAAAWSSYMEFLRSDIMLDVDGNLLLLLSNNVAYRRPVFEAVGRFDESFPFAAGEDLELGYRIISHGYQQGYWPDAKLWHHHQNTFHGYLLQQFRYGRGNYYFIEALKGPAHAMIPRRRTDGLRQFYRLAFQHLRQTQAPPGMWTLFILTPPLFALGGFFEGYSTWFQRGLRRARKYLFSGRKTFP